MLVHPAGDPNSLKVILMPPGVPCIGQPNRVATSCEMYYDPNKAAFQDFEPFWEFVSGPIHAGTFGPGELDQTFGPQLKFIKAPTAEQGQNAPPSAGLQFFGHVKIDGGTGQMTVTLRNVDDNALWATTIDPVSS